MPTLNQIADTIIDRLNQPFNIMLKERKKFEVKYWRSMMIRQDVAKNGLSYEFLQSFVTNLTKIDKGDNCVIGIDCIILRTKTKIPKPVRLKDDVPFKYVGEIGGNNSFVYTELEELKYTNSNKYTYNVIRYNYTNGYVYIFNNTKLKYISLQGIFTNPESINSCTSGGTTLCYNDDMEFPIADDMLQTIIDGIVNEELKAPVDNKEVKIEQE